MNSRLLLAVALPLFAMGCGESPRPSALEHAPPEEMRAPLPPETALASPDEVPASTPSGVGQASPEEMRAWEVGLRAQRDLRLVARAAYDYSIEHPDRSDATLDEVLAPNPSHDHSEFTRDAARKASMDPWGHRVQVEFKSKYLIFVTGAGPDGKFGTDDDLHDSTWGWQ